VLIYQERSETLIPGGQIRDWLSHTPVQRFPRSLSWMFLNEGRSVQHEVQPLQSPPQQGPEEMKIFQYVFLNFPSKLEQLYQKVFLLICIVISAHGFRRQQHALKTYEMCKGFYEVFRVVSNKVSIACFTSIHFLSKVAPSVSMIHSCAYNYCCA